MPTTYNLLFRNGEVHILVKCLCMEQLRQLVDGKSLREILNEITQYPSSSPLQIARYFKRQEDSLSGKDLISRAKLLIHLVTFFSLWDQRSHT